jgi:hypothetical protein
MVMRVHAGKFDLEKEPAAESFAGTTDFLKAIPLSEAA